METPTTTLEQVIYRLVEGATEDAFLATNAATQAWLEAQPGFLGRELAVDPDGTWVDHVWWTDLASAETAANAYMATDACHQLSAFLVQESVSFRHARIVRSTGVAATRAAA